MQGQAPTDVKAALLDAVEGRAVAEGFQKPKIPFFRYIWDMVHNYQFNWLQAIVGKPRVGKSLCALKMAEMLDKKFTVDKIAFTPQQFLKLADELKYNGEVIIFEEAGVSYSTRTWHTITNKMINICIQTWGYKHGIALFTLPSWTFLDKQGRLMLNCLSEVKRFGSQKPVMYNSILSPDTWSGDIYRGRPVAHSLGGMKELRIKFSEYPSEKLMDAYIERQIQFKRELVRGGMADLKILEAKGDTSGNLSIAQMVQYVINNKADFKGERNLFSSWLIQSHFNISRDKGKQIAELAKKNVTLDTLQ